MVRPISRHSPPLRHLAGFGLGFGFVGVGGGVCLFEVPFVCVFCLCVYIWDDVCMQT